MQATQNRYSTADPFSAQERSVSRQLYDFLKSHTNFIWGSGVMVFDPKLNCDHPIHRNHKADLVERFVLGHKVRPSVLTHRDVERHLEGSEKHYFTGSMSADEVLIYLDADCHQEWQDDPNDAERLLRSLWPNLYVCGSTRGRNGYILLRRTNRNGFRIPAHHVNEQLRLLEVSLRKLFIHRRIKTTIEVKGHIQHTDRQSYYCGKLAKLPNHGGMTLDQMEALRNTSRLTIPVIKKFARWVDAETGIPDEAVRGFYGTLRKFKDEPPPFLGGEWDGAGVSEKKERVETDRPKPNVVARRGSTTPAAAENTGVADGDSFTRGFRVCLHMTQRLQRVPSTEEVLDHLRENGLFTGTWEENEQKRAGRIAYNLDFIRTTFDATKLRGSGLDPTAIDLSEYRRWVKRHCPNGIGDATAEEVNVFLAITKFCLVVDPNENGSLPYQRFKSLWQKLYKAGLVDRQFRWERWAQIRNRLEADGLIEITGEPKPGEAQKWRIAHAFPSYSKLFPEPTDQPTPAAPLPASRGERRGRESYLTLCLRRLTSNFHLLAEKASELVERASFGFWRRE